MTPEQAAAYVIAQATCVQAQIAAMQTANWAAARIHQPPVYAETDFMVLVDNYGISHNAVLTTFQGAKG